MILLMYGDGSIQMLDNLLAIQIPFVQCHVWIQPLPPRSSFSLSLQPLFSIHGGFRPCTTFIGGNLLPQTDLALWQLTSLWLEDHVVHG